MKSSLSIGIVCFPSLGGSGVVASELAVGLAERAHSVHVIANYRPTRLPSCDRIRFHAVTMQEYPVFEHAPYGLALASKIIEVSRDHRLDLVQVNYAIPHATSAYLARQVLGASAPCFVTSLHGTDVTHIGADPSYQPVTSFVVAASDGITVPSEFLRGEAFSRLKLPLGTNIEVIPNFVATELFTPAPVRDAARFDALFGAPSSGPVIFHVSNFRSVKRVGDLVEALALVRQSVPARMVLVGDGPERAGAEKLAERLDLTPHVRFLGKRADFAADLRHADLFLLTSESESFGVAALEALSCGVPVVAYRVGGLPEVVSEEVGRLVPAFDVTALARAVVELLSDKGLQAATGRAARARAVAFFQRDPAIDRYEALFTALVDSRRRKAS